MNIEFTEDSSNGISDVLGFETAAFAADIRNKNNDRLDSALIFSKYPCTSAGVFTTNDVKAAPVKLDKQNLDAGNDIYGIFASSGNANACTGSKGYEDAKKTLELLANNLSLKPENFYVGSTGRIGEFLPMEKIEKAITYVCKNKNSSAQNSIDAANAILTSDTKNKVATASFVIDGKKVSISAMAKGAGMIEPNMATMLCFICTDAKISKASLQKCLSENVQHSFNSITVDGDMSTNDTVLVLANGQSGVDIDKDCSSLELFNKALGKICFSMAKKIVSDGEKITKVVKVVVKNAKSLDQAKKISRAIGNSLLVKSSWCGCDPNWGRLIDAAGYARTGLIEEKTDIYYNDCPAVLQGLPLPQNKPLWKQIVAQKFFDVIIDLNLGSFSDTILSTDLSEEYVNFNKSE